MSAAEVTTATLTSLLPGAVGEIVAEPLSSGLGLMVSSLIEGNDEAVRRPVALVDGSDAFDPRDVSREARGRLLWARCRTVEQALRVTDLLLRDGNMPRVLLDLAFCQKSALRRLPLGVWHRLKLLAEQGGGACVVLSSFALVPGSHWRLFLEKPLTLESLDQPREILLSSLQGRLERRGGGQADVLLAGVG